MTLEEYAKLYPVTLEELELPKENIKKFYEVKENHKSAKKTVRHQKPKHKYIVYFRYYFETEESIRYDEWQYAGETFAVSEDKAINNVRYRRIGKHSQYMPANISGHWENGFEWKARKA